MPKSKVKAEVKEDNSLEIHELNMRIEKLEEKISKLSQQIGGFYDYDIREIQEKLQKVLNRMGL